MKLVEFDRSTPWMVFHQQYEAVTDHNVWEAWEKAMHLLNILEEASC
jgi:hypothetical protein